MTFAEVMDKVGLEATTEQYGEMFKNSMYELWHAMPERGATLNPRHQGPDVGPSQVQTSTRTTSIFPPKILESGSFSIRGT